MSNRVCDCPEACSCYTEGYTAGREKSWFEMGNFDWTQHSRGCGCGCEPCLAFGKVLLRMLDHMAKGDDQEGRLVALHFAAWLKGNLVAEKLT